MHVTFGARELGHAPTLPQPGASTSAIENLAVAGERAILEEEREPLMVVFQKGAPRALSDVSFVLNRLAGQTLERTRLIIAPELKADVVLALSAKNG